MKEQGSRQTASKGCSPAPKEDKNEEIEMQTLTSMEVEFLFSLLIGIQLLVVGGGGWS